MARRVEVDIPAIQSMFVRGGEVYKFAVKVSDDVRDAARRRIRNRSRRLWRSVTAKRHTLPLGVHFSVGAYAPYALMVEEGTADAGTWFIGMDRQDGNPMTLYAGSRAVPAKYTKYKLAKAYIVKGQKPRHYLRNGLRAGLLRNSLRPSK